MTVNTRERYTPQDTLFKVLVPDHVGSVVTIPKSRLMTEGTYPLF